MTPRRDSQLHCTQRFPVQGCVVHTCCLPAFHLAAQALSERLTLTLPWWCTAMHPATPRACMRVLACRRAVLRRCTTNHTPHRLRTVAQPKPTAKLRRTQQLPETNIIDASIGNPCHWWHRTRQRIEQEHTARISLPSAERNMLQRAEPPVSAVVSTSSHLPRVECIRSCVVVETKQFLADVPAPPRMLVQTAADYNVNARVASRVVGGDAFMPTTV